MSRRSAAIGSAAPVIDTRPAPAAGRITVEIARDLKLPAADAAAIDALIAARPQVGVFVSRAWLAGLFEEAPLGAEPLLLLLRDGATLRGVAPVAIVRTRTHVRVTLLGGGAGSDRVDLLAARGFETTCADAFMAWIAESYGRRGYVIASFQDLAKYSRHSRSIASYFAMSSRYTWQ